jgi:LPXTG-motif cell wall-anchored protein
MFMSAASAWHPVVAGQATCSNDGNWTVVWTVGNSETVAGHIMTFDSVDVNGAPLPLSATSVAPSGSVSGASAHTAATNLATITVNARWAYTTPNVVATVSASVAKPGDCVVSGSTTIAVTTTEATTTTVAETTTTLAETTTTLAAPAVAGTILASQPQVADLTIQRSPQVEAAQVSAATEAATLPATGGISVTLLLSGGALVVVGVFLVAIRRHKLTV